MKRVVVISDQHCGHMTGLTPTAWQTNGSNHAGKRAKLYAIQKEMWAWYAKTVKALQPISCLIVNGDAIDGKGNRSGGTELITTDLEEQCKIAEVAILHAKADNVVLTYGTAYHTSPDGEDWENVLAYNCGAKKIGSHEWITVEGTTFDCKHHVGSSSIPHGRQTAISKEHLWAQLWEAKDLQPKSDIFIRSHVHYFTYCGGDGWLAMTTPPLQGMGTKYGSRRCSGLVDVGLTSFDCNKGGYSWQPHIAKLQKQKAHSIML